MIALGIVFLLLGYLVPVPLLQTLGIIALLVGLVMLFIGYTGRPVAGRRYWY